MQKISKKEFVAHLAIAERWANANKTLWMAYPNPHEGLSSEWEFSKVSDNEPDIFLSKVIQENYEEYQLWKSAKIVEFNHSENLIFGTVGDCEFVASVTDSIAFSNLNRGRIRSINIVRQPSPNNEMPISIFNFESGYDTFVETLSYNEKIIKEAVIFLLNKWKRPHQVKKILNNWENTNNTAFRKKGLSASKVAQIICRDNEYLLHEPEVKDIIKCWETDRKELQEYRKRERVKTMIAKCICIN